MDYFRTRTSGRTGSRDDAEDAHAIRDVRTVDEQIGELGGVDDVGSFAVGLFGGRTSGGAVLDPGRRR